MTEETEFKTRLKSELPGLLQQDPSFRQWLESIIRQTAVTPESFDARFDRMLQEFAQDRAEQRLKWEENERRWQEQNRRWQEQEGRWQEQESHWQEQNRRWQEQEGHWQEQDRKWHEQHQFNKDMLAEIRALHRKHDQSIGALGARWGIASEASFRAALKGILEESFGVQVLNINEFDDQGIVFGRPDQVEIDIIIKNGEVLLCELKSPMSRADMYNFARKADYYSQRHQRHQRPITRKLAISPMVPPPVVKLAEQLGIEVFTDAQNATGLQ